MKYSRVDTAVICAAGMGSRLGLDKPKCLVDLGSYKLIYYLLKLLEDFAEVRIVVGFREQEVIQYVKSIREDVIFVRNADYNNTTNAYSLYLGSHDLKKPYLTIDGDMIVDPDSFQQFLTECKGEEVVLGLARAKTEDAVFVGIDESNLVREFSREPISELEWSGIAYLPPGYPISKKGKYVYQEIEQFLPVRSHKVVCWEIDTPNDLNMVMEEVDFLGYGK